VKSLDFLFKYKTSNGINYYFEKDNERMAELKLITGGKTPPADGNWLSELETGTVFLISDKQSNDFTLGLFKLVDKTDRTVTLFTPSHKEPIYVHPIRFCNRYNLWETLMVLKVPEPSFEKEEEPPFDIDIEDKTKNTLKDIP